VQYLLAEVVFMLMNAKPLIGTASVAMLAQIVGVAQATIPSIQIPDQWAQMAEHLTLTGALIIAVAMLWRSLQAKDAELIANTKAVTDALSQSAASNVELRRIIQDSIDSRTNLNASIDSLQKSIDRMNK
jgi:hypothetical protein